MGETCGQEGLKRVFSFKDIDHLRCVTCALFLAEGVRPDFQIHVFNTRIESVKAANGKSCQTNGFKVGQPLIIVAANPKDSQVIKLK